MRDAAAQRRQAFNSWLRTGRLPACPARPGIEYKFNPWHDPKDGRFTFTGAGKHYSPGTSTQSGGGRQGRNNGENTSRIRYFDDLRLPSISTLEEVESWRAEQLARHGDKPGYPEAIARQYQVYLDKLGHRATERALATSGAETDASGSEKHRTGSSAKPEFSGGGGSYGGSGATGSWDLSASNSDPASSASTPSAEQVHDGSPDGSTGGSTARPTSTEGEQRRTIIRNGYTYEVDSRGRTRRVSGVLSNTDTPVRSRTNQAKAGGADRRPSDDGGHYIAARFDGPTEAFNHFAQNANFNRGRYRAIEDQWARAKGAGKEVTVKIVPHYHEGSMRPYEIDVSFSINGREHSVKMPNVRTEKPHGR